VEIGGSFRVPEIMERSGARLVEVGTTNRTHLDDYRRAVGAETGAIVKVHRSNFELSGFVAEVSAADLSQLAVERKLPFLYDLGSGLMMSLADYGLTGEPTAADAIAAGASLVTMSGDKLLGGPQAGLLLGKRELLDRVRTNPLTRAFRVDKLTLAALEATLALYREPDRARAEIPALMQLTAPLDGLHRRALAIIASVASERMTVLETRASVGGGAFPTAAIPSLGLAIAGGAEHVEHALRAGEPAVICRIADGSAILDLRTVFASEDASLIDRLRAVLA
jgi:L-seryl-tRNA(Ser) seleniumtransferase